MIGVRNSGGKAMEAKEQEKMRGGRLGQGHHGPWRQPDALEAKGAAPGARRTEHGNRGGRPAAEAAMRHRGQAGSGLPSLLTVYYGTSPEHVDFAHAGPLLHVMALRAGYPAFAVRPIETAWLRGACRVKCTDYVGASDPKSGPADSDMRKRG